MKFTEKTRRFRTIYSNALSNSNLIVKEQNKIEIIEDSIKFLTGNFLKNVYKYNTNWSVMEADENNNKLITEWDIDINKIPAKFIPFIEVIPIYKSIHNNVGTNPTFNYIFKVIEENLYNNRFNFHYVMKIKLLAGLMVSYSGDVPEVNAKLLINIYNPELYI